MIIEIKKPHSPSEASSIGEVRGTASIDREHQPGELTPDRPPRRPDSPEVQPKRGRGFAAMDRKLVSEIARKGGKAAHSAGTAHEFTSEEARVAGRKGGRATHAKRRISAGDLGKEQASPSPEKSE